jgi:hypothetical protein
LIGGTRLGFGRGFCAIELHLSRSIEYSCVRPLQQPPDNHP